MCLVLRSLVSHGPRIGDRNTGGRMRVSSEVMSLSEFFKADISSMTSEKNISVDGFVELLFEVI